MRPKPPLCPVTGKIQYKHPQAAWNAMRNKKRSRWREGGHAYQCPHCKQWHWTSIEASSC